MDMVRPIFIIDDHQLFGAGMQQMLASALKVSHIHCFDNPEVAFKQPLQNTPLLIILDFYIPGYDVIHWIALFAKKFPISPIVIISSSFSPSDKKNCMDAGANAFFEKHLHPGIVLDKIKDILDNNYASMTTTPVNIILSQEHGLTDRQIDTLIQLARGKSNKKIAERLDISPETVKSHLSSIYKALNLYNRDAAVDWAREHGLV